MADAFGFDPHSAITDLLGFGPALRDVRQLRSDVLWLNRPEHLVWGQVLARWSRIPIVCHLHTSPDSRWVRQISRGVAHFVAVSEFMRRSWGGERLRSRAGERGA